MNCRKIQKRGKEENKNIKGRDVFSFSGVLVVVILKFFFLNGY